MRWPREVNELRLAIVDPDYTAYLIGKCMGLKRILLTLALTPSASPNLDPSPDPDPDPDPDPNQASATRCSSCSPTTPRIAPCTRCSLTRAPRAWRCLPQPVTICIQPATLCIQVQRASCMALRQAYRQDTLDAARLTLPYPDLLIPTPAQTQTLAQT